MIKRISMLAAACSMAGSPCLAADFAQLDESGGRRTGAGVGAYFAIPLGGPRSGRTQAGLRATVTHDYRDARAQTAPVVRADAFDLRLVGDQRPTLYMAGRPVTGERAREQWSLGGTGRTAAIIVIGVVVVAGVAVLVAARNVQDE